MSGEQQHTGLVCEDLELGTGEIAEHGCTVCVHYTGWLENGEVFDSSRNREEPLVFPLGAGYVIRGWDEGVQGMRVGGRRRLTILPDLGYGAAGAGDDIPPDSTLIFEIELLEIY